MLNFAEDLCLKYSDFEKTLGGSGKSSAVITFGKRASRSKLYSFSL